jgi:glutamate racemase
MTAEFRLNDLPIGVFDSGVGGLTVLKELKAALPEERFIYLADTARLPYGTKTPATITAYALQAVNFLLSQGIKFLVIACNTATALALPTLKEHFPKLPMMGVIEPGAHAALRVSKNKNIAVLATLATVSSKAYEEALLRNEAQAKILAKPATLLVSIAEEGFLNQELTRLAIVHYLEDILNDQKFNADTLILGCTHFPVLRKMIEQVVAGRMHIVDSAEVLAIEAHELLQQQALLQNNPREALRQNTRFLVTDGVGRFMQVAEIFLQQPINSEDITLVDIS